MLVNETCENDFVYRRNRCGENINKFQKRLSDVKWQEILNNNANDDYNKFVESFETI